jgi:uncharacterized phage protein (TIGR02220 family)
MPGVSMGFPIVTVTPAARLITGTTMRKPFLFKELLLKWFKHSGSALRDAKIQRLIIDFGIEGYGLYFACVEIIAGNLASDNITFELEHDAELLANMFKMDTLKVEKIMKKCIDLGLFQLSENGTIACRKLAKWIDNTTSQTPQFRALVGSEPFQLAIRENGNFKKLQESDSRIQEKRREENTIQEKDILSGCPDAVPVKNEKLETAKRVIDYLNECTGKHFRHSPASLRLVMARMKEGHIENDFRLVIDYKVHYWFSDLKMKEYLRPHTLFGTKFESYRQEVVD